MPALQRLFEERLQANSDALDSFLFAMVGSGLDFRTGRSLKFGMVPHNRLLLSLAHGFRHHIPRFGNPMFAATGRCRTLPERSREG